MSHTVGAQTTSYTWDVNAGLPVVLQDGANTYVHGLDLISATDGSGNQTYFTYDGLGSTADLTNGAGAVTGHYTYDAFGATLSGPAANAWQYTGEQRDADSGLYYLRARYYDPATGRFLGKDPLGIGNRYSYVGNNPTNFVDPHGLFPGVPDITPDFVDDVIGDAIDAAEAALDDAIDVIHITPEGVFVGGVLVVAGAVLAVSGVFACTVVIMEEVPNPATWPVVPHSLGVCSAMVVAGASIYVCGWSLILTSWCLAPLPADTAEAKAPGKE